MDLRCSPHDTHLDDPGTFEIRDPHLRQLQQQPLVQRSHLLEQLPDDKPGMTTLRTNVLVAVIRVRA